jgi:glycosyltransferase involved in cell wall biosynthesis
MVSICIPAYKKPEFVKRVLDSLLIQSYRDLEVVISDDSPDDGVKLAIESYKNQLNIHYYQNNPSLTSPKNWNAAIDKSSGDYFMLMHQDDWFHDPQAIEKFLSTFNQNPNASFVFSRNTALKPSGEFVVLQGIPSLVHHLNDHPNRLVMAQVIGPPSNIMLKKEVKYKVSYDERFIWLVDVDYNSRLIKEGFDYAYVDEHLVTIGLHQDQTTEYVGANLDIKFRENIWFAQKIGAKSFDDWQLYDYFWRLLRNFKIRGEEDIEKNKLKLADLPADLLHMYRWQIRIPYFLLKLGLTSKLLMILNYFFHHKSRAHA